MSRSTPLTQEEPWVRLDVDDTDWASADPTMLAHMYTELQLIRVFEEKVLGLAAEGLVHGPAHSSIGQEGGAVGSVFALKHGDTINGSHRGHHQFLAKALQHVAPNGIELTAQFDDDLIEVLTRTLAEICGLSDGFGNGRGGSMHLKWAEAGAMGTNAIVGGGVPQALGFAWSHRQAGTDNVSVSYFGDGAVNIGSVLESLNLAAAWKLPVCFFIENNRYAVSTTVAESTAEPRLSARGPGFGIPSWQVDGMDPLAVHTAMTEAVALMRAGGGPTIIEADVYRYFHQNGPFPGSAFGYRDKSEEQQWRERDPLALISRKLIERDITDETTLDSFHHAAEEILDRIIKTYVESVPDEGRTDRQIRSSAWPDTAFVDVGVLGDLSEFTDISFTEQSEWNGELRERKFIEIVSEVMHRRLKEDDRVLILGEDVHRLNGGTNGATRGLSEAFPDRVLGTPISENAFCGMAGGIALDGRYRPIVELMFADFMWVAADQIFNQIAKVRHMFGGNDSVPLVIRSKVATSTGYGSQHSMDPAGVLAMSQGLRIAAPSTPFDYIGIMNAALTCEDPVVIIEHVDLYASTGDVPTDDRDFYVGIGRAAIRRSGDDITVLSYLNMVDVALTAVAEADGLNAEVIDLRWLDRASLDWETIGASIRKTNNVVIIEQGAQSTSYGAWLADEIQRRYFDWLDQPVQRVTGGIASPSISKVLEAAALAGVETVTAALQSFDPRQIHSA
ncbi:MAG: alpha-ketoacid dehydrogenase subunit alpha/beta [Leucobacter sp.]